MCTIITAKIQLSSSASPTPDNLSALIQENQQARTATDVMGMSPLQILCYNPHATTDMMMQIAVKGKTMSVLTLAVISPNVLHYK